VASVRFLGRAALDLEEAVAWYEARSQTVARRFETAVTAALARIAAMPQIYALVDDQYRLCPIHKSQYLIAYRFDPPTDEVVVIAVPHAKQDPKTWLPTQ
jgi:plasmid stabilization system protein ParE